MEGGCEPFSVTPVRNSSPAIAGLETLRGRSPSGAEPGHTIISNGVNEERNGTKEPSTYDLTLSNTGCLGHLCGRKRKTQYHHAGLGRSGQFRTSHDRYFDKAGTIFAWLHKRDEGICG